MSDAPSEESRVQARTAEATAPEEAMSRTASAGPGAAEASQKGSPVTAGSRPDETRNRRRVLLLGGTGEARRLAEALAEEPRVDLIVSLAGSTSDPLPQAGAVRRGGFGGAEALADYLAHERVDLLVDATHPFAATISPNAAAAAQVVGRPYLRLERPPWAPVPGDEWRPAVSLDAAAAMIPAGATVFLAVGAGGLAPFVKRASRGVRLLARMVERPAGGLPAIVKPVFARGPFDIDAEIALLRAERINLLVAKNAGGEATEAKLAAARRLRLPVIMVARPPGQPPADAATVEEMLALIARHLPDSL
jgi:precorrin-6A/cobalt-precorrin-6A reductase